MAVAPLRLNRLPVGWEKRPDLVQHWWQQNCEATEKASAELVEVFETLAEFVGFEAVVEAALEDIDAALIVVEGAAALAQETADNISFLDALRASFTTGLTIGAVDAGADATINISAHTREYGDGTSVAVSGGALTGLAYSTSYWVYYQDAARAGGAVTYQVATTPQGNAIVPDRHFVGAVTTPAAAAPPNDGIPVLPPGGVIP